MSTIQKSFVYAGSIIPIIFWGTTFLCGSLLGQYNHLTRLVSELGAIGTRTQSLFTAGLVLCSVLSLLFIIALIRIARTAGISTIPILILLTFTFSIGGAAFFPLPLPLHGILGSPVIFMFLSPAFAFFLWGNERSLAQIKLFSLVSFFILTLGFSVFLPSLLEVFPGLKQRVAHLGWSIWFIYLSYSFSGLLNWNDSEKAVPTTSNLT